MIGDSSNEILLYWAWAFFALGPQLLVCMGLGYLAARRSSGSLLNWLTIGFLASVLPGVGVIIMVVLAYRARPAPPHSQDLTETATDEEEAPQSTPPIAVTVPDPPQSPDQA